MAKIISGTEIARQVEYSKHTIFIGIHLLKLACVKLEVLMAPAVILTFG